MFCTFWPKISQRPLKNSNDFFPIVFTLYTPCMHTYILFSRFYTLLSTLVTVNTKYTFYFFLLHHCTLSFITAHFVHHCTLKQALALPTAVLILCWSLHAKALQATVSEGFARGAYLACSFYLCSQVMAIYIAPLPPS